MQFSVTQRSGVAGTAMRRSHFLLLYSARLVAASGNTAVQSVMPAIGRAMAIPDVIVAIAYTISAVLWVALAPVWARASDRHGRKALIVAGVGAFVLSSLLCGLALYAGLVGWVGAGMAFVLFGFARAIYGGLGSATPSATQAYLASKTRRSARVTALSSLASSFGLGTVLGPALAPLFVLPVVGLPGPFFGFAIIGLAVLVAIALWLPDDTKPRHGRRAVLAHAVGQGQHAEQLAAEYNRRFNSIVLRDYSTEGRHLTFPGMAANFDSSVVLFFCW